ncbi:ciliogenesis-associated TTC17-interacting protein isoform X3 [Patagioenas fasciata]|uniref:ciliogenesis-associated TTC17-interacting protein isoform X3 n=1 Tax=Patagioenas fasciata TaxID=372321 RepID=UPI003A995D38
MEPPAECQQETPALTAPAAEFLSLIGLEELECCLFAETLQVVTAGDQAGGQWWAEVRWAPYKRAGEPVQSCFLVQAGSRGRQDGVPCSSTLKAYVTPQLETLEQEEQEHLQLRAHAVERRTRIVSHQHGMTVTKTLQEQEECPQAPEDGIPRDHGAVAVSQGGHVSLQGEPKCQSFSYSCDERALGIQQQAVGSTEVKVFVIERAVHTSLGISTIWQSGFLPSGHLARRVQVGCPRLLLLQAESVLGEIGGVQPQPTFPKQPLDWEEDIQLCSWFLDQKVRLGRSHGAVSLPSRVSPGVPRAHSGDQAGQHPPSSSSVEEDPGILFQPCCHGGWGRDIGGCAHPVHPTAGAAGSVPHHLCPAAPRAPGAAG